MKLAVAFIPGFAVQTTLGAGTQQGVSFVDALNKNIRYEGRVGFDDTTAAKIYWAGSSATIRFIEEKIKW